MSAKIVKKKYATVSENEGVDYRTMSETMTAAGFKMNHSSARNHVLRVMRKFAEELADGLGFDADDEMLDAISKSAMFQDAVADLITEA